MIRDWRSRARALRRERAELTNPADRIAHDNVWVAGVPRGLLVMALEIEEHELDEPNYIPPVLRVAR